MFILFDLQYVDCKGNVVNSISYTRKNMIYILVYNKENYRKFGQTRQTKDGIDRQKARLQDSNGGISQSYYRDQLYKTTRRLAKEEFILFGLDQFKNYLFKNVYTFTEEEFQQNFINARE